MKVTLAVKKIDERAILPKYATNGSCGLDLFSFEDITIYPQSCVTVNLGLAVEIPEGHKGEIQSRSGLRKKFLVTALYGLIDHDYRGPLSVQLKNEGDMKVFLPAKMSLAQLVVSPYTSVEVKEVEKLSDTARGVGGFGSTGLNARFIAWKEACSSSHTINTGPMTPLADLFKEIGELPAGMEAREVMGFRCIECNKARLTILPVDDSEITCSRCEDLYSSA